MRMRKSVYVDRSVEDVFWYVADLSRHTEWRSELLDTQVVGSVTQGVGTHFHQRVAYQGRRLEANLEITDFIPGEKICIKAHGGVHAHGCIDFKDQGCGTLVGVSATIELKGAMGMMERYIQQAVDRVADADFERLKVVLESGA